MRLVQTPSELEKAVEKLDGARTLYLDTEFESARKMQRLSLIQIWDGAEVLLVDALRLRSLAPLSQLFADPEREWVLHAAMQDVQLLTRDLSVPAPQKLFDTQVVWALISAEYSVSLSYLVYCVLGKRCGKPHQADDWLRRPLPASQLRYAAEDVENLPALHAALSARAHELGRFHLVHTASREVVLPERDRVGKISLDSFRNAWQLEFKQQAGLRCLIEWHNALTVREKREAPEPKTLLSIAGRLPETVNDLCRIKGVSQSFCQRHGAELVSKLRRATQGASEEDFRPIVPPAYASFDEIRLDAWLGMARAEICASLSVAPELALPQKRMRLVRQNLLEGKTGERALAELGTWRKDLVSAAFEEFSRRLPPPRVSMSG